MGEIADALKRAREEREARRTDPSASQPAPAAPEPAAERPDSAPAAAPAEPAPPPEPLAPAGPGEPPLVHRDLVVPRDEPTAEPKEPTAHGHPAQPVVVELEEESLAAFGRVDLHRHLALQVSARLESLGRRSLAVVSALRDEGKTTVACTLAMALASVSARRSVALVDLDLRNPSIARRFALPRATGIERFLVAEAGLDDVCISIANPLLDVFPSIEPQRAAHELLARPQIAELVSQLEQRYDTIIFDTPPTLIVPDSNLLLRHVGACLTVARMGVSRVRRYREMLELLPEGAVVGKVLNSAAVPSKGSGYYDYSYGPEGAETDEDAPEVEVPEEAGDPADDERRSE